MSDFLSKLIYIEGAITGQKRTDLIKTFQGGDQSGGGEIETQATKVVEHEIQKIEVGFDCCEELA